MDTPVSHPVGFHVPAKDVVSAADSNGVVASTDGAKFVTFFVGRTLYGIDAGRVAEVIQPPPLTRLPNCSPNLAGVVAVRGEIVAVVNLRVLFGEIEHGESDKAKLIVLSPQAAEAQLALPADALHEVLLLQPNSTDPPPFLSGVAHSQQGSIRLIESTSLCRALMS